MTLNLFLSWIYHAPALAALNYLCWVGGGVLHCSQWEWTRIYQILAAFGPAAYWPIAASFGWRVANCLFYGSCG